MQAIVIALVIVSVLVALIIWNKDWFDKEMEAIDREMDQWHEDQ